MVAEPDRVLGDRVVDAGQQADQRKPPGQRRRTQPTQQRMRRVVRRWHPLQLRQLRPQWGRYAFFELVYGAACLAIAWLLFSYAKRLPETVKRKRPKREEILF